MEDNIADEYRKNNRNSIEGFVSKIGATHIVGFIVIVLVVVSLTNNPEVDRKYIFIVYAGILALVVYYMYKPTKEKALLPEHAVKSIAQEALNRKVREGIEFDFDSKVYVMSACHLKYESDLMTGTSGPVAWEVGFEEHVQGKQYKREGVIRVHPYEGKITGISFYPLGYSGRESRDKTIVPVGVVQGNIKTSEFGSGMSNQNG